MAGVGPKCKREKRAARKQTAAVNRHGGSKPAGSVQTIAQDVKNGSAPAVALPRSIPIDHTARKISRVATLFAATDLGRRNPREPDAERDYGP